MTDTFPKLLAHNAKRFADRTAIREKDLGIWQSWTWRQMHDEIMEFAAGLQALGLTAGDKVAVLGQNRPVMYWAITATQAVGAIPIPVYQDSVAEELQYVLAHSEANFVVAENQEQVDKCLEILSECPKLTTIIYDDTRGMRDYTQAHLHHFADVKAKGRDRLVAQQDCVSAEIDKGKGDDICVILYTSGTTGKPKGVVLTQDNVMITSRNSVAFDGLTEREETLSYLPLAWVGDFIFSFGQAYVAGYCINCPESEQTVATDLREIGPTYYFAPPRVFESILTSVIIRMEDASKFKKRLFDYFMAHAKRVGVDILNGDATSLGDRLIYWLGDKLIYGPLKNTMGFSRIRIAYTAGEAIGPEIFEFFRALGINIKQLYGQTEACVFITMQPDGEVYADTVGVPSPEVEVKITDDGEVLYRSPGVFKSYFKNSEATADTKDADGWVYTGDAGFFDDRQNLRIIDRAKDVGKLDDGSMFAPKYIENKLKFFPQIQEAVAIGADKPYVSLLVNIDLEAVGNWAERNNIGYASYQELAGHPAVYDMVKSHVEQVNSDLASDSHLSGAQVKRFLILHKELDADDGELTRTRKVRRRIIAEKFAQLIDAIYSNKSNCYVKTEVAFEDGRKGVIEGDLKIYDVATYQPLKQAS